MLILALDTSTRGGSIAALHNESVLGTAQIGGDEPYSASIPRDVDALLSQLRITLKQIDLFAVAAGPGSFTGLRVGLTAVKAWAELFAKPIAAVSVLEAIAIQAANPVPLNSSAPNSPSAELIAAVLDAHRGQIFGALYRRLLGNPSALEIVSEEVVASVEEFIEMIRGRMQDQRLILATPTPEVILAAMEQAHLNWLQICHVSGVLAPVIGRLGYRCALRGEVADSLRLDANYVRRPDAEIHWKRP